MQSDIHQHQSATDFVLCSAVQEENGADQLTLNLDHKYNHTTALQSVSFYDPGHTSKTVVVWVKT